jgi:uncharacterized OB-fold protein
MGVRKAKTYHRTRQRGRKTVRLCRLCGKNAHPNYFFCPACHHKVSSRESPEDSSETGFPVGGFRPGPESRQS